MGREMRRKRLEMAPEEARALLERGEYGVMACMDADGAPYGVPISYVYLDGAIYLHGAREGHKWECLERDARVSFTVVGRVRANFHEGSFGTLYESVVAFGTARRVPDGTEEKRRALAKLCEKVLPQHKADIDAYVAKAGGDACLVVKIPVERLSGKTRFN